MLHKLNGGKLHCIFVQKYKYLIRFKGHAGFFINVYDAEFQCIIYISTKTEFGTAVPGSSLIPKLGT